MSKNQGAENSNGYVSISPKPFPPQELTKFGSTSVQLIRKNSFPAKKNEATISAVNNLSAILKKNSRNQQLNFLTQNPKEISIELPKKYDSQIRIQSSSIKATYREGKRENGDISGYNTRSGFFLGRTSTLKCPQHEKSRKKKMSRFFKNYQKETSLHHMRKMMNRCYTPSLEKTKSHKTFESDIKKKICLKIPASSYMDIDDEPFHIGYGDDTFPDKLQAIWKVETSNSKQPKCECNKVFPKNTPSKQKCLYANRLENALKVKEFKYGSIPSDENHAISRSSKNLCDITAIKTDKKIWKAIFKSKRSIRRKIPRNLRGNAVIQKKNQAKLNLSVSTRRKEAEISRKPLIHSGLGGSVLDKYDESGDADSQGVYNILSKNLSLKARHLVVKASDEGTNNTSKNTSDEEKPDNANVVLGKTWEISRY
ncbi:unnamed protein product [Moneuplotes crassus]|uniref:Uncharacterized protein n=1 Tax=Euplotes crassus TaxID=5936 RepID=A0AAD1U1J4_EUPCR|nr:unnamed protein product [Moneuplotes crassus]